MSAQWLWLEIDAKSYSCLTQICVSMVHRHIRLVAAMALKVPNFEPIERMT